MSRIGKKPVQIPAGVKVSVKDSTITVQGPQGTLTHSFRPGVSVAWDESEKAVKVTIPEDKHDDRFLRACWGSTRAHIANMVVGVTKGYEKSLEVVGVGFVPSIAGKQLKLVVGFANPILLDIPAALKVTVDKQFVKIAGPDKQLVGQFAAMTRAQRKPEPYNGKGIKYTTETIRRKQGKQFGA